MVVVVVCGGYTELSLRFEAEQTKRARKQDVKKRLSALFRGVANGCRVLKRRHSQGVHLWLGFG